MAKSRTAARELVADDAPTADDLGIALLEEDDTVEQQDQIASLQDQIDALNQRVDALSEELMNRPNTAATQGHTLRPPLGPVGPNDPIMVKATDVGLYGRIRQVGDVFQIMSHGFSDRWMEKTGKAVEE